MGTGSKDDKGKNVLGPQYLEIYLRKLQPLKNHGLRADLSINKPALSPTIKDIAWAAGVYEGEGSIAAKEVVKKGVRYRSTPCISITQKDPWLTDRLRQLFGGKVYQFKSSNKAMGDTKYCRWVLHGPRCRGFAYTIYSFLSPRRKEQILKALGYE